MYGDDDYILSDIMAQRPRPTPFDLGAMLYGQPPAEPPGAFTPGGVAAAPPAAPVADVSPQPTLAEDDQEKRKADWRQAMQGSGTPPAPGPSAGGGGGQAPKGSNLGSKLLGIGGAAAGTAIGGPIGGIIGGGFGSLIGSLL